MAFISETKPRRANLTSFDHMDLGHRTLLWQHIFSLQVVEAMEATEAKPTSTIQMQCCSSAIEVLNLNKPILLQDYFNTSNLQCWSSAIEVVVSIESKQTNTTARVLHYFRIQCWINATEVLVQELQGSASTTLFPRLSFFESASTFTTHMAVREVKMHCILRA